MQHRGDVSVLTALARGEPVLVVVLGGGMSCVVSLGVLVALVQAGLHTKPKAYIGVSGGACNIASLLSTPESIGTAMQVYEYMAEGKFLAVRWSPWGPYLSFNIGELLAALSGERAHLDLPTLNPTRVTAQSIPFWAAATHAHTGRGAFFDARKDLYTAIRASMSIPGVCDPVIIDGEQYLDGFIGMKMVSAIGKTRARKVLVIMNRPPPGSRGWWEEAFSQTVTRMALGASSPAFREAGARMDSVYAAELERLYACARFKSLVIYPDDAEPVMPWSVSISLLRTGYTHALEYTTRLIDQSKAH
jgi:predicted patatin/cPLA2 family phospholipase